MFYCKNFLVETHIDIRLKTIRLDVNDFVEATATSRHSI